MATIYINSTYTFNGDGTTPDPATSPGGVGAKNAAVTSPTANNTYSYARGTTTNLGATSITVAANGVTITAHGTGALPIIDAQSTASFAISISTANNCTLTNLDLRNGSNANATLNITGTCDTTTITDVNVSSALGCVLASGAGITNLAILRLTVACSASNSIAVNLSNTGAGVVSIKDSTITHSATDRSQSNLLGLTVRSTAGTLVQNCTITGGNIPLEVRGTDSHTIKNCTISTGYLAGIRLRDSNSTRVEGNTVSGIWNGKYYNGGAGPGLGGGAGAGIDITDVSGNAGNNVIIRNTISNCYQGILDISDNVSANIFCSNIIFGYLVNGISYQAQAAGQGLIANNSIYHHPSDPVLTAGHGIVIQNQSVNTTARIVNNVVVSDVLANNVQCVNIPLSASTGATFIDYNNWYTLNGAHLGALGGVNYDTLAEWQTALGTDVDTTGDDAHSKSVSPSWLLGDAPTTAAGFSLKLGSTMIRAGIPVLAVGNIYADQRGYRGRVPPDLGACQRISSDP